MDQALSHLPFRKIPGTSHFYEQHYSDIVEKAEALGPPMYFFTLTNRTDGVHLATAVSQTGLDVFHVSDEMERLRQNTEEQIFTGEESEYFVHRRSFERNERNQQAEHCQIHENCLRTSLSDYMPENEKRKMVSSSLYNISRIYNDTERNVLQNILLAGTNSLKIAYHHTLKEYGESTGWCHSHGLAWRKESDREISETHRHMVLGTGKPTENQLSEFASFCDTVVSVSLDPVRITENFDDISEGRAHKLTQIARKVNIHRCIPLKCYKEEEEQKCWQRYPRLPSTYSLIARPPPFDCKEKRQELILKARLLKDKVRITLQNSMDIEQMSLMELLTATLGRVEETVHEEDGLKRYRVSELEFIEDAWLNEIIASSQFEEMEGKVLHAIYTYCLMWDKEHRLVLKREVGEAFVVQYELHVLEATGSNHSMEIITRDRFAVYNYVTKRSETCMKEAQKMKQDLHSRGHTTKASHILATAADHREITQSEAYFRIDPSLEMARTNLHIKFINTKFPDSRSKCYRKDREQRENAKEEKEVEDIEEDEAEDQAGAKELVNVRGQEEAGPEEDNRTGVHIEGKEDTFFPQDNWFDWFEMIPEILKLLVLAQFVMNYVKATPSQSVYLKRKFKTQEEIPKSSVPIAVSNDDHDPAEELFLPTKILLRNGSFMIKTRKPSLIQTPKFNVEHNQEYSDLLLYSPWSSEGQDLGDALDDMAVCSNMHGRMDRNPEVVNSICLTKIETIKSRLNTAANTGII